MADLETRRNVTSLEILSRKTILDNSDRDEFIRLVTALDRVDGWETEFPNLADFVKVTFDKFNNKEYIKIRVIRQLKRESSFLLIFNRVETITTVREVI